MLEDLPRLSRARAILNHERLFPVLSGNADGALALLVADEALAEQWLAEHGPRLAESTRPVTGHLPVGEPWSFMQRAAQEGLAGFALYHREGGEEGYTLFRFVVAVEEAWAEWPTVLMRSCVEGRIPGLTSVGMEMFSPAELLPWTRYDVLDPVSGTWGLTCPFGQGWQQGDVLYELGGDGVCALLADVPLLGPWNAIDGAFAFFTNEEQALAYLEEAFSGGANRVLHYAPGQSSGGLGFTDGLGARPVPDLAARLKELAAISPISAWCINPTGHRGDSGFGRLFGKSDAKSKLYTTAGAWKILSGNRFERLETPAKWSGSDTRFWSYGPAPRLGALETSFEALRDRERMAFQEGMPEEVVGEWLRQDFDGACPKVPKQPARSGKAAATARLASFHLQTWDAATGERSETSLVFGSFLETLRYLAALEREHDRHLRVEGARGPGFIGFAGSRNRPYEEQRGEAFQHGLVTLGLRALVRGYLPQDGHDLVTLCNRVLRSEVVDFAGYAKDLLWAVEDDGRAALMQAMGITKGAWRAWRDKQAEGAL